MLVVNHEMLDQFLRLVQVLPVDNVLHVRRDILALLVGDLVSGIWGLCFWIYDAFRVFCIVFPLLVGGLHFHGFFGIQDLGLQVCESRAMC
jgi:hypothetical protein